MIAAEGVLTARGGKTSHAAVVARGMGKTCVCGAEALEIDEAEKQFTGPDGVVVREGDVISVDGTSGAVYLGEVPVIASNVVQYFEGELEPDADALVAAVHTLMTHADDTRRLGVRANADNGPDCARARRFGAGGVGLVRTEHMFLGERRQLVEDLILAGTDDTARRAALDALEPLQRGDFGQILAAMDGLPVTIRLIDPPLHEFLPDFTELSRQGRPRGRQRQRAGSAAARGGPPPARAEPDARPARRPARPGHPRPVRHAGPRDRARDRRPARGGRRPAAGDHDPAGRDRAGARDHPGVGRAGAGRGGRGDRGRGARAHRHDDRGAAGRRHRRARSPSRPTSSPSAPTT